MSKTNDLSNDLYQLHISFAVRALLGGGKGKLAMSEIKKDDEEYYNQLMDKASEIYKDLPQEWKDNPEVGLVEWMKRGAKEEK